LKYIVLLLQQWHVVAIVSKCVGCYFSQQKLYSRSIKNIGLLRRHKWSHL